MVNYCCVEGCGRNSRRHNHLNFYSLPKERDRQLQWLKAAGREDLLVKEESNPGGSTFSRFCSRHFPPSSLKKNRRLIPDSVPSLCLPGGKGEEEDPYKDPLTHADILCNSCSNPVVGFRYKCVTCDDYDLCPTCEQIEVHSEHYMLRIPKPMKYKLADNLIKKWRAFFKKEHSVPVSSDDSNYECSNSDGDSSSDDEPITKYVKNYDSGVDISEDAKEKIRKEIKRVLSLKPEEIEEQLQANKEKTDNRKRKAETTEKNNKKMKTGEESKQAGPDVPEVVFADVNEIPVLPATTLKSSFSNIVQMTESSSIGIPDHTKSNIMIMPSPMLHHSNTAHTSSTEPQFPGPSSQEIPQTLQQIPSEIQENVSTEMIQTQSIAEVPVLNLPNEQQPVMHVKLSDDLTELMIEVTSNNQRTIYKYSDAS